MEGLWTISASSEPLLQQCIENAPKRDESNKWQRAFLRNADKPNKPTETEVTCANMNTQINPQPCHIILDTDAEASKRAFRENEKNLCDLIENDLSRKFNQIVEEITKDGCLFTAVAEKVSETAIERFCKMIYENNQLLNSSFIVKFLNTFLPAFLRSSQSWHSIDVLVKASKTFPKEFKSHFIPLIIKDVTVPNKFLLSFIETLSNEEKTELILMFSEMDITDAVFIHHLNAISSLYKDCERHLTIQSFIFTSLKEFGDKCSTDKVFGRLLLSYLQTLTRESAKVTQLENIINNHRTVFKKVCTTKLENLMKN